MIKPTFATMFAVVLLLPTGEQVVDAFFQSLTNRRPAPEKVASFALTTEAIQVFNKKYPFGRDPPKKNPFLSFGMPSQPDSTGKVYDKDYSKLNKRFTDISEQQATEAFIELATVYGEERALGMVKALPVCLAFEKKVFGPSFQEWTAIFGLEQSQEMVARNPGLLAVKPEEAAKSNDQTMAFSYIVGYTRPLGPVLLPLLMFLLLSPAIEEVTGIPIRSSFLAGF
jgi:hypothetical protein